jgi:ferritin-like protein
MAASSASLHEPDLPDDVINRHRAIVSIMEELEAVDWYDQRAYATNDGDLAEVLAHNRDEEKEHAVMTLEWLRRHDPKMDEMLRTYLFTTGSILAVEEEAEHGEPGGVTGADPQPRGADAFGSRGLGIGSLRGAPEEPVETR